MVPAVPPAGTPHHAAAPHRPAAPRCEVPSAAACTKRLFFTIAVTGHAADRRSAIVPMSSFLMLDALSYSTVTHGCNNIADSGPRHSPRLSDTKGWVFVWLDCSVAVRLGAG